MQRYSRRIDRFFEATYKRGGSGLGTIDLMLLSTAKYLMDYYGFTRTDLFIITLDKDLYKIAKSMNDIRRHSTHRRKKTTTRKYSLWKVRKRRNSGSLTWHWS